MERKLEIKEAISLLIDMRNNCIKPNQNYDDPKRMQKAEALMIAISAIVDKYYLNKGQGGG